MSLVPSRISSKPQYVFHPTRVLRRAMYTSSLASPGSKRGLANLPWGLALEVYQSDAIGFSILASTVFDPCVTEAMHRLIDPGDLVVDVGANVGYLTSLAAARVGSAGTVIAYEPHPGIFDLLALNVARWGRDPTVAKIELHQAAMSDEVGRGELATGPGFRENMGVATLLRSGAGPTVQESVPVAVERLDDALENVSVGLLKVDVEGHELEVLRGASKLLHSGAVRDIVFEDHQTYPSEVTEIVEGAGYRMVSLDNDLWGLRLGAPEDRGVMPAWPGPSYLATRDLDRAHARLGPRGWQVKGIGPTLPWRA